MTPTFLNDSIHARPANRPMADCMTTVRNMRSVLTPPGLEEIRRIIGAVGVLAIPTETYYALGASPFSDAAIAKIGQIKGRPEGKPILVLLADPSAVEPLVADLPAAAEILMRRFWPGPLTIVLPARRSLPTALTAGSGTIGVRQPDHALLLELLAAVGPLTGTSANRSGDPPAQTAEAVRAVLGGEVDMIVDGGMTPGGLSSTVVSAVGPVHVLREGRITRQAIAAALADSGVRLS